MVSLAQQPRWGWRFCRDIWQLDLSDRKRSRAFGSQLWAGPGAWLVFCILRRRAPPIYCLILPSSNPILHNSIIASINKSVWCVFLLLFLVGSIFVSSLVGKLNYFVKSISNLSFWNIALSLYSLIVTKIGAKEKVVAFEKLTILIFYVESKCGF